MQKRYRPVNISRMHEYEIDNAIKDLERRGYELVSRGRRDRLSMETSYHDTSRQKFKYKGMGLMTKYWAVLKLKEEPE
ncbi:hypothetical protein [Paenibacillus sp. MMO-58]|uniref:hypothetical protein n=1 Tax=Paenibacillus sp. MMO-58 TaxID=3081290 RepID=UPI003019E6A1